MSVRWKWRFGNAVMDMILDLVSVWLSPYIPVIPVYRQTIPTQRFEGRLDWLSGISILWTWNLESETLDFGF